MAHDWFPSSRTEQLVMVKNGSTVLTVQAALRIIKRSSWLLAFIMLSVSPVMAGGSKEPNPPPLPAPEQTAPQSTPAPAESPTQPPAPAPAQTAPQL